MVISSDEFNWNEKKKKCYFTYEQRKALVEAIRYVDLVIPETCWEQKKTDVHEYHIDTFVMGDDWKGKFDFLKEEGVEVVYLSRTPEISTTQIKSDLNRKVGNEIGNCSEKILFDFLPHIPGRIAKKYIPSILVIQNLKYVGRFILILLKNVK